MNKRAKTQMMKKIINALLHLQYNFQCKNRTNFIIDNKKALLFLKKIQFFFFLSFLRYFINKFYEMKYDLNHKA